MKKFFTILFTLFILVTTAQIKKMSNGYFFVSDIKVERYANRPFRFSIDIQSKPSDTLSYLQCFVHQMNDEDFVETHYSDPISKDTLWHNYVVAGRIAEKTKYMWCYMSTVGNGEFLFDNIKFEVQNANNSWITVPIPNDNFERATAKNPLKGYKTGSQKPDNTIITIVQVNNPKPSKALLIKSSGGKMISIINYGNNQKAGKFIATTNSKIYHETYGEGEPLLLLHGNGQSVADFRQQIPEFSKKFKVIAVDTRGQGKSIDTLTKNFSYDLFAKDMKELLDSLNLRKVNIVGWSDGGNTALTMAINYPEYVKKVAIMGANLNASESAIKSNMLKQVAKDLKDLQKKGDTESLRLARLLAMLLAEPNITVEQLHTIQAKVLVMAGEKDLIKEAHTKLIAEHIKGSKLIIFKGQTHFLPEENASLFNATVLEFLGN